MEIELTEKQISVIITALRTVHDELSFGQTDVHKQEQAQISDVLADIEHQTGLR